MSVKSILIVEDEYLVGLNIQSTLMQAGYDVFGPALNVQEALQLIRENELDAAVLDVNLGGEYSDGIASRLTDLDVPYVLLTGYDRENLPPTLAQSRLIEKPFMEKVLVDTIESMCTSNENPA